MAERTFGPVNDYHCFCGANDDIEFRYCCNDCGVEAGPAWVRSQRWGHIELAAPIPHPLFTQIVPGWLETILAGSAKSDQETLLGFCVPEIGDPQTTTPQVTSALERTLETLREDEARGALSSLSAPEQDYLVKAIRDAARRSIRLNSDQSITSERLADVVLMHAIPVVPAGLRPILASGNGPSAAMRMNKLYAEVLDANARMFAVIAASTDPENARNAYEALQHACDALLMDTHVMRMLLVLGPVPRPDGTYGGMYGMSSDVAPLHSATGNRSGPTAESAEEFVERELVPSLLSVLSCGDRMSEYAAMEALLALGHCGNGAANVARAVRVRFSHSDVEMRVRAMGTFANQRQWEADVLLDLAAAAAEGSERLTRATHVAWRRMMEAHDKANNELLDAAERAPADTAAVVWEGAALLLCGVSYALGSSEERLVSIARSQSHEARSAASKVLAVIQFDDIERERVAVGLLRDIGSLSDDQRTSILRTVATIGLLHESVATILLKGLGDRSPNVRGAAAMALAKTQPDHVAIGRTLARAFLVEKEPAAGTEMILALAQVATPDREVLSALGVAATHPEASVRAAVAAFPQRELRSSQLERMMFALLQDPEPSVAAAAADAIATRTLLSDDGIGKLRELVSGQNDERASTAAARGLGRFASRRVQAMWHAREAMRDLRPTVRAAAAQGAGESTLLAGDLQVRLTGLLRDDSALVRRAAAIAFSKFPIGTDAILALAEQLQDEDDSVRLAASESLLKGDKDLTELLWRGRALVSRGHWRVTNAALKRLKMRLIATTDTNGGWSEKSEYSDMLKDLVPVFVAALHKGEVEDKVLISWLRELDIFASPAVPVLQQLLGDPELAVEAALALAKLGADSSSVREVLRNQLSSKITVDRRLQVVVALAQCGERIVDHLALLGFALVEPWFHRGRLEVLDALEGSEALTARVAEDVIRCFVDMPDDIVRLRLVESIGKMGRAGAQALPALDALAVNALLSRPSRKAAETAAKHIRAKGEW
ncbi:MAG: hypothetical protein ABI625_15485 [bacterium]